MARTTTTKPTTTLVLRHREHKVRIWALAEAMVNGPAMATIQVLDNQDNSGLRMVPDRRARGNEGQGMTINSARSRANGLIQIHPKQKVAGGTGSSGWSMTMEMRRVLDRLCERQRQTGQGMAANWDVT